MEQSVKCESVVVVVCSLCSSARDRTGLFSSVSHAGSLGRERKHNGGDTAFARRPGKQRLVQGERLRCTIQVPAQGIQMLVFKGIMILDNNTFNNDDDIDCETPSFVVGW